MIRDEEDEGVERASTLRFGPGSNHGEAHGDEVAVEAPLEIRHQGEVLAVTMRTPGHDEELIAGFAFAEGLNGAAGGAASAARRGTLTSAACGVCGRTSIDDLVDRLSPLDDDARFSPDFLRPLSARLLPAQPRFARTGGLHAAGIISPGGDLLVVREDVGRHNAVDKVVGRAFLDGKLPLSGHVLLVSGRSSFEIVQKAIIARFSALVSVSAPSSLAVELAQRFGLLLVGFSRGDGFVVYAGAERLVGVQAGPADHG